MDSADVKPKIEDSDDEDAKPDVEDALQSLRASAPQPEELKAEVKGEADLASEARAGRGCSRPPMSASLSRSLPYSECACSSIELAVLTESYPQSSCRRVNTR